MPVVELLAALERNAAAQAAQVRATARDRATAIIARAAADVDRRRAIALQRFDRDGRTRVARDAAAAERELRQRILVARAELLERIFTESASRLAGAGIALWEAVAPWLVADTLRYLEGGPAVLQCPADAAGIVRRAVGSTPGVVVEAGGAWPPGVRGQSRDGHVVVDNTLTGRLQRMRSDLAVELARRLEPEEACAGMT